MDRRDLFRTALALGLAAWATGCASSTTGGRVDVTLGVGPTLPEPPGSLFGHLGDGSLHLEVVDPEREWDAPVLVAVAEHGGSISAEHGIGRAKRDYLHLTRSAAEIAAMREIKRALDPRWVLNPGILLPNPSGLQRRWRACAAIRMRRGCRCNRRTGRWRRSAACVFLRWAGRPPARC